MYIEVDISTIPPVTTLREPDDFTSLKVVIRTADDAFIAPQALAELAGGRARDEAWQANLEKMLQYARDHHWMDSAGRVQAHIETSF